MMMDQSIDSETQAQWKGDIFAITLFVDDLDKSKDFYQTVFNLPIYFEDHDSAVFKFKNLLVNLLRISEADELIRPAKVGEAGAGNRFVLTLPVDNVDVVCERLASLGVELLNGPMDRPWGTRTASFQDPSGHIWEIAH